MEFVCNECGVSFNKNKSLLRHVRTVHQGMKRADNEKRKRKSDRQEIGHTKIAPTSAAAEDIIPEESTVTEDKVSEDKPANTRYKYHLKTIPESVICFDFVGDSPETEDLKIMVEDCFEELIRA